MKPIGTILKNARLSLNLSQEDVSKKTKIRKKYIDYIEQSEWDMLPGVAYTKGFVKSYAEVVGLDADKVIAIFRREFIDRQKNEVLPSSFVDMPAKPRGIFLTIKRILSKLFA